MSAVPREDLVRAPSFMRSTNGAIDQEMRATEDGKTMTGYPIVFGEWTEIHSWEGKFRETIEHGAVTKTLKERGDKVIVAWNHGYDPSIGDKPICATDVMEEQERGLWTESPFIDRPYAEDIRQTILQGAIKGMSFRFSVTREEWNEDTEDGVPERTIKELRLYEFGPVTYPAYEATIVGIRSQAAYSIWRSTNPAERTELLRQFGVATDLSAPDAGAATSGNEDDAPLAEHPSRQKEVQKYLRQLRIPKETA